MCSYTQRVHAETISKLTRVGVNPIWSVYKEKS